MNINKQKIYTHTYRFLLANMSQSECTSDGKRIKSFGIMGVKKRWIYLSHLSFPFVYIRVYHKRPVCVLHTVWLAIELTMKKPQYPPSKACELMTTLDCYTEIRHDFSVEIEFHLYTWTVRTAVIISTKSANFETLTIENIFKAKANKSTDLIQ